MQLWSRRRATDTLLPEKKKSTGNAGESFRKDERTGRSRRDKDEELHKVMSFDHEVKADRKGVGFAYGGVSPGTLHARGQLVRVHTVHYSIGLAGRYRLHVGLRQQSVALPGSPFDLEIVPGNAYAPSTKLPKDRLPLRGVVGDEWRGMVFFAADKIGNQCVKGGAKVKVSVDNSAVESTCNDNGDGSYSFQWRSQRSGTYSVSVLIDGVPVVGSPTMLTMLAANLDVGNCAISGSGLSDAVAGDAAVARISCKDKYSNLATPSQSLKFGISLQQAEWSVDAREKRKIKVAQSDDDVPAPAPRARRGGARHDDKDEEARDRKKRLTVENYPAMPFEGAWVDGEYEIRYMAQKAGDHQLHVWADTEGKGVRELLPGSPFTIHVVEANASPASSSIGYPQEEKKAIYAGERLLLRPQLRDQFGNPSAAGPETLKALLEAPDGPQHLVVKPSNRGLGAYEVAYESLLKGEYTLHVELNGMPIGGSPGVFFVQPAVPTAMRSKLLPPVDPPVTHALCEMTLVTYDKLGNALDRGGARVDARVLGASAGTCSVEDRKDGTYNITFTVGGASGEYRVIARMDNVEMPPVPLMFAEGSRPNQSPSGMRSDDESFRSARKGKQQKLPGSPLAKGPAAADPPVTSNRGLGGIFRRALAAGSASMTEVEAAGASGRGESASEPSRDSSPAANRSHMSVGSASDAALPTISESARAAGAAAASTGGGDAAASSEAAAAAGAKKAASSAAAKKLQAKPLAIGKVSANAGPGQASSRNKSGADTNRGQASQRKTGGGDTSRSGAGTNRNAAKSSSSGKKAGK